MDGALNRGAACALICAALIFGTTLAGQGRDAPAPAAPPAFDVWLSGLRGEAQSAAILIVCCPANISGRGHLLRQVVHKRHVVHNMTAN